MQTKLHIALAVKHVKFNVLLMHEVGDKRYKLLLTETDRDILIRLVESKPIPDGTKSRLIDNYKFFSGKIADRDLQPAEIYESIGKLQIVNITLDRTIYQNTV